MKRFSHVFSVTLLLCATGFVGSAANANQLFFDNFESAGFAAGGWLNEGFQMQYLNHVSPFWAAEGNGSDKLTKALDTTGYENINITYYRKGANNWPWDTLYVEYTTNFGASWNVVDSVAGNFGWTFKSINLPAAAANNGLFGIRFRGAGASGSRWYIDDVAINGDPITYTVSTSTVGNGSIGLSPSQPPSGYSPGTQVSVTATPDQDWQFDNWSGALSGSTNPDTITVNSNLSVTAHFSEVTPTYTLTTNVTGQGSIDVTEPGPYDPGETVTVAAIPDSGWEFVEWTGTIATTDNPIDITFNQNHNVTAVFQQEQTGPQLGTRVLMVGDSWTAIMTDQTSLSEIFANAGFSGIYEDGDTTAIGGTTAAYWADPANLQLVTDELNANPDLDMVHLSMGGNDFLAGQSGGGWYKGMGASAEASFFDTVKANIRTVIEHVLSIRPSAHIVVASYDYINLWDTVAQDPGGPNAVLWANLGSPTPRELNDALIELGNHQHELALEFGSSVTYVNNWGQMHLWYGYNQVFDPGRFAAPWGHPSYPVPLETLAGGGTDAIHLDEDGYEIIALNCWNNFYQYLIDPAAGELPPDVDSYPPPPSGFYSQLFYDGFEDQGFSTANWTLSGTTFASLNTLWGNWSLEADNGDTATRGQSTAGYENIRVAFNLKTSGLDAFPQDTIYAEYTVNGGGSWDTIEQWTSNFDWSFHEYLLPVTADNNANFGFRIRASTNSNNDNAWIDEFVIDGVPIPCTLRPLTLRTNGTGDIQASPAPDYGSSDYCDGTMVTLTAVPADGWTFEGWSGAATGTSNPVVVTMDAAKSVTATFEDSAGKPGLTADQLDWTRWVSWGYFGATWPEATTAQIDSLLYKANEAQNIFETYHMPYGQAADVWYTDQTRSTVSKYETIGDSSAFLGYYLGGLANQYAVTGDSALLTQIDNVLDTIDFLTQCSGKDGYIVRFAGDANDPAYQAYYQGYGNGYDTCVAPWTDQVWLDYSSRDTYFGIGFGLGNVWIHIQDQNIRNKCQTITERIIDSLIADNWNIVSPNGPFTNFTFGHMLLWQRLGISMNDPKYGSQYNYGSTFWWAESTSMGIDEKYDDVDYFSSILTTCNLYVVRRLETNQDKINALNEHLLDAGETDGGDHLNAHFAAIYAGATGDGARNIPRGVLQSCLIDYESGEHWMEEVDQSGNPWYPPYDPDHSVFALLVRDRPGSEYIWQREPTRYAGGVDGVPIAYMMLDKYVPYWIGREGGAIPAP